MQLNLEQQALPFKFTEEDLIVVQDKLRDPILQGYIRSLIHQSLVSAIDAKTKEQAEVNLIYCRGGIDALTNLVSPNVIGLTEALAAQQIELNFKET